MGLADIAAGVEVTERQRDCGVAAVDDTDAPLAERLGPFAEALPCSAEAAATVVESYAAGNAVDDCGHAAGVPPVTAAKTLHLLGEQVSPLGPRGRDIVRDWLSGTLSRGDARTLADVGERTFALAAYVESHDPVPAARDAVEGALSTPDADPLAETHSDVDDLL
ncbi:hypothetical protein EGH21_05295 [Halomicroarcula sp. F13]|uniref:Uncharacterized protein n=1 Tax=Haloarcula rubra TaxID=2487747 RepID=A0AAW4PMZ0_9EURY|nr:hypothetical protein [Halomicroarcula rubra]MBX0322442.1 hypothetical protein [Halomicroarcula rubra]